MNELLHPFFLWPLLLGLMLGAVGVMKLYGLNDPEDRDHDHYS